MTEALQPGRAGRSGHFLDELGATFANQANRPAILAQGGSWTYQDLDAKARRCAARLRRLGAEPGDRVALITPRKLPFLVAHLGALHVGAISLPLNPKFTPDELRYFLRDSGARVVGLGRQRREQLHHPHPAGFDPVPLGRRLGELLYQQLPRRRLQRRLRRRQRPVRQERDQHEGPVGPGHRAGGAVVSSDAH
jgi:long-subunit acyl-CoA synthetase (AMP-forming)